MDEEPTYPTPAQRPNVRKLPKEPSWILLGFLLGAAFIWLLPVAREGHPPAAGGGAAALPPEGAEKKAPPVRLLSTIEAVFAEWGRYAVWENDLTEVALWSADHAGYAECWEVLRNGDTLYFRSIPKLTRPIINYGAQLTSPLLYTETENTRAARSGGYAVPLVGQVAPPSATAVEAVPAAPRPGKRRAPVPPPEPHRAEVNPPPLLPTPQAPTWRPPETILPAPDVPAPAPAIGAPQPQENILLPPPPATDASAPAPTPPAPGSPAPAPRAPTTTPAPAPSPGAPAPPPVPASTSPAKR